MLSALPPLGPHDAHSLWYPSLSTHTAPSQEPPSTNNNNNHAGRHAQQVRSQHPTPPARTLLSILRADENTITTRKGNIRRFGAGWLRPPGVGKTMQGIWDERAEREEQEAVANREMALMEAQAAAEAEEIETGLDPNDPDGEGHEQDLDEEIPDADEGQEAWVDEDVEDGMPVEEGDGDYAEGESMGIGGDMTGRDLDEDVPEAGSYQHTDTDVEDPSSDEESGVGLGRGSLGTGRMVVGGVGVLGSSVFGSSPIVEGVAGGRRSGGFARGSQNREN